MRAAALFAMIAGGRKASFKPTAVVAIEPIEKE
jgi:hypothetical protein